MESNMVENPMNNEGEEERGWIYSYNRARDRTTTKKTSQRIHGGYPVQIGKRMSIDYSKWRIVWSPSVLSQAKE